MTLSLKFNLQDRMLGNQAKKKKLGSFGSKKSSRSLILSNTSLASMESLSMPQNQEIVLSADLQCAECRKKVYDVLSIAPGAESMVVDVREKKVILSCKSEMKGLASSQVVAINKTPYFKIFRNFFYTIKN